MHAKSERPLRREPRRGRMAQEHALTPGKRCSRGSRAEGVVETIRCRFTTQRNKNAHLYKSDVTNPVTNRRPHRGFTGNRNRPHAFPRNR